MTTTIYFNDDSMKKLMMDTLFICIDYRNMSAHGSRIYNYHSRNTLRKDEIFHADYGLMSSGFSELLFILSLLSYTTPFSRLNNALQYELNRHCSLFPDDSEYLSKVLNIDIVKKDFVYYEALVQIITLFHHVVVCRMLFKLTSKRQSLLV